MVPCPEIGLQIQKEKMNKKVIYNMSTFLERDRGVFFIFYCPF
jgi:hypothetical protein